MADRTNNHPSRVTQRLGGASTIEFGRDPDLSGSPSAPSRNRSTLNSQLSTLRRGGVRRVLNLISLILIAFLLGCGKKPPAAYKDFSKTNTVGVILGEVEREYDHGLQHLYHEKDGFTQPATVRNMTCRCINLANYSMGYLYFRIDPTFKKQNLRKVKIEVEYFDDGEGRFGIQYDAGPVGDLHGRYTFLEDSVNLTRSRSWQTHTFEITNAFFNNSQNSGADFRLYVVPPKICIRSVTVTRIR